MGMRFIMASQKQKKVIVAGGGASGLMAAIQAKSSGAEVTLLEENNTVGKKIAVTGNGKCNFTHVIKLAKRVEFEP